MRTLLALLFMIIAVPPAMARVFPCTAGDAECIKTAIAHSNLDPTRPDVIELDASTFTFDRQDNGDEPHLDDPKHGRASAAYWDPPPGSP